MGKKAKVGKKRKDKFYHLAKETGYRARSAFKLIQLNRKFGFLQESRVLIDLCAAPGGWLQVAANFMPLSSVILGIDLVAIKPIKNVTTFQADITTDQCRQLIKKELKTWKADVVLNDGAPNVGSAWVQDAFSQIRLALSALKLASDHLRKGGWFITKVFRSKDYNALLWVLQQLFKKVHSTKPQASRNESAEIFVVCQGYLAPDKLDEKFLDPKHVFKEIEGDSKVRLNILKPEKQTRQREGYPENNITLHTTITAMEFLKSNNAIDLLATCNKIDIKDEKILNDSLTTDEIIECCKDIKVLGRSELKLIFAWRKKLRKTLDIGESKEQHQINVDDSSNKNNTEHDEENEVDEMVEHLKEEEAKELKKKKKRVREQKKKLQEKLATKLASANVENTQEEQDLFGLNLIKNSKDLSTVDSTCNAADDFGESDKSENENNSDDESDTSEDENSSDEEYVYGADELYEKPSKHNKIQQLEPVKKKKKQSNLSTENPLVVDLNDEGDNNVESRALDKAKQWFQKDVFKDAVEENDSDYDIEELLADKRLPEKTVKDVTESTNHASNENTSSIEEDMSSDDDSAYDSDVDDRSISQGKKSLTDTAKAIKKDGFETVPMTPVDLGAEGLALGTAMATSKKRARDIIDDSFNRYTFNDDNLPSWFIEDEHKHTSRQIPVTREEVQFYKDRMREINARPIKKVIEAKAKKKSKLLKKLDRARRKAQGILDATETSNIEKQNQIKGIYKKAGLLKNKKPDVTYVVAKRGLAGKRYKRPSGVKGQYKVVDPRMKKDLRSMKNKEKTKGRSKKK